MKHTPHTSPLLSSPDVCRQGKCSRSLQSAFRIMYEIEGTKVMHLDRGLYGEYSPPGGMGAGLCQAPPLANMEGLMAAFRRQKRVSQSCNLSGIPLVASFLAPISYPIRNPIQLPTIPHQAGMGSD